ncbi:MAG TPA: 3-keto-5-aminohexanoate cleavage protein [Thermodesulfobacteriota bacterium]|nr:3-keto-5-aminohexanoate cleavage protein [Thermodesulfobacteriota bacterium]
MDKVFITAAVTGSGPTRKNSPYIPYTPEEIANEIIRSFEAGAAISHVHVRDPKTGAPAFELEYFKEIRERVRSKCDILLNFTTSAANLKGENLLERRLGTTTLNPDLCTHDIGSMNYQDRVFINPPEWGPLCCKVARERGVKPELECFDAGHVRLAVSLVEQGLVDPPYLFQICLGVQGGMSAGCKHFMFMKEILPEKDVVWTTLGIGREEFPMAIMSLLNGGHVRVGFEDNVYLSRGVLAKSNGELVEKAVRLAREIGRDIMTPDEVRKLLRIPKKA